MRILFQADLNSEESRLREEISGRDASPFLGQHSIPGKISQAIHSAFIAYDARAADALIELLSRYPAISVAFVASLARTKTGQEGHNAFYQHLSEALGVDDVPYEVRKDLWRAFRKACVSLGLPIPTLGELHAAAKDRYRLEYFVQAGPLNCDLPLLGEAFVAVSDQIGNPDPNDSSSCRAMLDAVLFELGDRNKTLQRVLANDRAAWHAAAFGRLQDGAIPRNDFERTFKKAIEAAALTRRTGQSARRPIAPRLVFSEGGIALRTPAISGWTWTVSGPWECSASLGPDQEIQLGNAENIDWWAAPLELGTRSTPVTSVRLPIWSEASLLIFDGEKGALLGKAGVTFSGSAESAHIVARQPFCVTRGQDEAQSQETMEGLHVATVTSSEGELGVQIGQARIGVELAPRPVLFWADPGLCTLEGKPTFGSGPLKLFLQLPREERADWLGRVEVLVSAGRRGETRQRALFEEEDGRLIARVPAFDFETFERLSAWVTFRDEERPLLHAPNAWLWPGLQKVTDGSFIGAIPSNFNAGASRGVVEGHLGLAVAAASGRTAELAFTNGDALSRVRVHTGDIQLELIDRGVAKVLCPGATVLDDGSPKQLRIWCSDRDASLDLCGIVESRPFRAAGRRSISLAGLGARGGSRRIEIWPRGDKKLAHELAVITRPAEPTYANLRLVARGEIGLSKGATLLGLATQLGHDRQQAQLSSEHGLRTTTNSDGLTQLAINPGALGPGVWLVELCEVLPGDDIHHPLRTARGDRFAILVGSLDGQLARASFVADELLLTDSEKTKLFLDVNAALMKPWARESWEGVA